jgi:hypothetical protein
MIVGSSPTPEGAVMALPTFLLRRINAFNIIFNVIYQK